MLPRLPSQLLFFLTSTSLLLSTHSADTATWLFPAYVPNAPLVTFESQDTIDAAWTSVYVAPVLTMFCQTGNNGPYSISEPAFHPVFVLEPHNLILITVYRLSIPSACSAQWILRSSPQYGAGHRLNMPLESERDERTPHGHQKRFQQREILRQRTVRLLSIFPLRAIDLEHARK